MLALHLMGGDHFWIDAPLLLVLSLFVFLGAAALRAKIQRWTSQDDESNDKP